MSLLVKEIENTIKNKITDAAKKAFPDAELPIPGIEIPGDTSHGDYASNIALASAKILGKNPREIAESIKNAVVLDGTVEKVEVAGPGFLNFFLGADFFSGIVLDVLNKKENYGKSDLYKGKTALVEFVSANPTGPMHIGNARGGALGDSLVSVLDFAGYDAKREFYVNDAGNQINKFKASLEARYLQLFDSSVEISEDCYLGEDIIEHAKAFKEQYGDKYLTTASEERQNALCDFALPKNIAGLKTDLSKYRINYDRWFFESELHNSGRVKEIIEALKATGYTYTEEGALWFKSTAFGDEKDRVLVRADGVPTYLVPDIAYHYDKLVTRKFDMAVDILGADHHGYVPRLKAALTALGAPSENLKVVIMQMVRLVKNGETYKLSKRSGKAVTLSTLLDEVPLDAARYIFNSKEPNTHLEFDLDLAVTESSENPVYYVQYAHARICSIVKNLKESGIVATKVTNKELNLLTESQERELIRHIAAFTSVIETAATDLDPSKVTKYAYDTATLFHKFYNSSRVKCDDEDLCEARLNLCLAAKTVIANCLNILKIDAPEAM